jgi:hypothetical protein
MALHANRFGGNQAERDTKAVAAAGNPPGKQDQAAAAGSKKQAADGGKQAPPAAAKGAPAKKEFEGPIDVSRLNIKVSVVNPNSGIQSYLACSEVRSTRQVLWVHMEPTGHSVFLQFSAS